MIKLDYISVETAEAIKSALVGRVLPSENRVLVFSPGDEEVTSGGLIIPGNVKEGKPRKGVAIISGKLDENHLNYEELTRTGIIITYGLYAGKEVEFDEEKRCIKGYYQPDDEPKGFFASVHHGGKLEDCEASLRRLLLQCYESFN